MEIHNNEIQQKTGGKNEEIVSEDPKMIELDTDGQSSDDSYYSGKSKVNRPFSMSEWLDTEAFPSS